MKEIPMLFSTPMVQAILAGRKTETRRNRGLDLINENPDELQFIGWDNGKAILDEKVTDGREFDVKCPYGQVGDLIWVRETCYGNKNNNGFFFEEPPRFQDRKFVGPYKTIPSIHMPKAAARIWLQITEIKVERLHDITEEGAIAEGIEVLPPHPEFPNEQYYKNYLHVGDKSFFGTHDPIYSYRSLWASINGFKNGFRNPWVWVVKYKVLSVNGKPEVIVSLD